MKKSKYVGLLLLGLMVIGVTGGVWTSNEFIYKPSLGARGQTEKDRFDVSMERVDNRLGKEIWVGDPNYGTTLQDAITAIGSTGVMLHIPAGTHNIAANLTIPVNVNLKPERGAILTVATTKTLTVNGGLEAGFYQVFSCTGTGTVVFGNKVPKVYVQWFGAVGDGSTDDATPINQAAICARASTCKWLTFPPCAGLGAGLGFKTTAQLDLRNLNIEAGGTSINPTVVGTAAVLIGGPSGSYSAVRLDISLYVYGFGGGHDWTAGGIGILCKDLNTSKLRLAARGFAVGIQFEAGTYSCCYNEISLGEVTYNKIGFYAYDAVGGTGWANENLVLGGNFGSSGTTGHEACIKMKGLVGGWVFEKPSLEHPDGVGVIFDGCDSNTINDARYEMSVTKVAQFINAAHNNLVTLNSYACDGHLPYDYDMGASPTDNAYLNDVRMNKERPYSRVLDITNFDSAYSDGVKVHVPGFDIISTAGAITSTAVVADFDLRDHPGGSGVILTTKNNYPGIGRKLGFMGSPSYGISRPQKLYVLAKSILNFVDRPQLMVFCYDSAGNILSGTNPATGKYYVTGEKCTSSGSFYMFVPLGANSQPFGTPLLFDLSVTYAFVGTRWGGQVAGLEIYSPYDVELIPTVGPRETPGHRIAAQSPTKWHFKQGEVLWNSAATTGAAPGWMCIKRVDTTLTADGSGGNTTITVNSITGIASGDIIGVKLDTGLYHFTTVNGAPVGNTVSLTAALPGTGVVATSGNAAVANLWKAMPNL